MNITFFIGSLYGGGAERCVCGLSSFLVQNGHNVEVLTVSETKVSYRIDNRVKIRTLYQITEKKSKLFGWLIRINRLLYYLIKANNDVFVVMLPKTTILLLMFKWLTKAKIIVAERSDPYAYRYIVALFLKYYSRKVDAFVFQTEIAKSWYIKSIKRKKTIVIPNPVNPSFVRPTHNAERDHVIIGVGRLSAEKNFTLLINAFAKIANNFKDFVLVIYGEGKKRKTLELLIQNLGLSGRVLLPGNVTDIASKMEKSYLYVLSSDVEGMPNALIEAMALGLPCIATDCPSGGPRYLIQDGKNGFLVPLGNVEEMSKAIEILLSDINLARKIGEAASTVKDTLDQNVIYKKWMNFIEFVVNGRC